MNLFANFTKQHLALAIAGILLVVAPFVTVRSTPEEPKAPEVKVCSAPSLSEDIALLQKRMDMCEKLCFQLVEEFDATTNRCKCFKE
jgi:hypothetical protein